MVMMHVWFIGLREHIGEFAGERMVRPLFLLFVFFCLVEIQGCGFAVLSSGTCGSAEPSTLGWPLLLRVV